MSTFTLSDPGQGGGFTKEEHVGHLCLFVEPQAEETAKYSGEGTQTAARCTYAVCITCNLVLEDLLVFGEALAPRLIGQGELVTGTLQLGKARPPRSAPYVLDVATNDERTRVQQFLGKYAARLPSGKIVIETPAVEEEE